MERYTVMLIPDHQSEVRRFRVSRGGIGMGVGVLCLLLISFALLGVNYLEVRGDTDELTVLRKQSRYQEEQLAEFKARVDELNQQLEQVFAFERKIRVIADLPAPEALGESEDGAPLGGGEVKEGEGGQGGGEEWPPSAQVEAFEQSASPFQSELSYLATAMGHTRSSLILRERSLVDLIEGLEAKQLRLASMPSIRPTRGWISSLFGTRISPFTGRRERHKGIDIATEAGTPIVAAARGKVTFAGRKGPLGRSVVIDHGYGFRTIYGHASKVYVKKGQQVERGERVAAVGNSGRSTGPHLHYSVERDGKTVDPMDYILD